MKFIKINAIWCPACILTNKIWKQAKKDYPNLEIEELDYDFDEDEVKKYNAGDILPVSIFFDGEKELERLIGEKTKEEIKGVIEKYEKN